MASNFDKYAYTKNGVVETSALLATTYGRHILNLGCESDLENGCVAKVGAYKEAEVYKAEAPAITDEIVLIANQVKIYEEYNTKMQEESQYYIKKVKSLRVMTLIDMIDLLFQKSLLALMQIQRLVNMLVLKQVNSSLQH